MARRSRVVHVAVFGLVLSLAGCGLAGDGAGSAVDHELFVENAPQHELEVHLEVASANGSTVLDVTRSLPASTSRSVLNQTTAGDFEVTVRVENGTATSYSYSLPRGENGRGSWTVLRILDRDRVVVQYEVLD